MMNRLTVCVFAFIACVSSAAAQDARVKERFGAPPVTRNAAVCWTSSTGDHGKDCDSSTIYGQPYPKKRQYLRATTGSCTTTGGCTSAVHNETSSNDVNYFSTSFANGATQCWQVDFGLPPNYANESTFTVGVEWTPATGTSTGVVVWRVRMLALRNDNAIDTTFGSGVNVTDTFIAVGDIHVTADSGAITAANSPVGGDHLWVDICRLGSDGSDTLDGAAELIGAYLIYQVDRVSSED